MRQRLAYLDGNNIDEPRIELAHQVDSKVLIPSVVVIGEMILMRRILVFQQSL